MLYTPLKRRANDRVKTLWQGEAAERPQLPVNRQARIWAMAEAWRTGATYGKLYENWMLHKAKAEAIRRFYGSIGDATNVT
jgi:3-phenylpropionate/cinnamic acid dioxygenase small subunit